jgi:hypothetical protein
VFSEQLTNGGDVVTDSALKELEARNKVGPTQTSKSTLIIHSVQRVSTIANTCRRGVECGMFLISTKGFCFTDKRHLLYRDKFHFCGLCNCYDFLLCFILIMHLI